jgi:hypothetical protein
MRNVASGLGAAVDVDRGSARSNSLRDRFWALLAAPSLPTLLVGVSFVLTLRSLGMGLQGDDHTLQYGAQHGPNPLSVFQLEGQEVIDGMQAGRFPWWTNPNFSMRFFRPVPLLTHWLDFHFWPNAAWAMYLQNIALYALIVVVAGLLYRRLLPAPAYAGLAALMFTMSPGHAQAVGWISSRNSLQTTLFSLLALLSYVIARSSEGRTRTNDVLSTACTALALLSGEAGLTSLVYIGAYALVLDSGPWLVRLRRFAPQIAVCGVWAVAYVQFRCGIRGLSLYRELNQPMSVLVQGTLDLPIWLFSLVGPSVAGLSMLLPTGQARLIALLLVAPLLACLVPSLRVSRHNRFFALVTLLCVPPLFTTLPQDRLLIAASFGAFGWIAGFLALSARGAGALLRGVRGTLYTVHLWLAPPLFVFMLGAAAVLLEHGSQALVAALPPAMPPVRSYDAILINSPNELLSTYATMIFKNAGAEPPRALHQLYAGASEVSVLRVDDRTLEVEPVRGWGSIPTERISSSAQYMPRSGDRRELRNMRVAVTAENSQGMPARVRFEFPTPLEAPDRLWLIWRGAQPVAWRPPAIGERVVVPGLNVMKALGG